MKRNFVLGNFVLFFLPLLASRSAIAQESKVDWLTGSEFKQQLETPVGLDWQMVPLREKLQNLARNQRVAIWLDRRVDPDRRVTFSSPPVALEDLLLRLTHSLELGVSYIGPVVYIGPKSMTAKLATVAAVRRAEIAHLPLERRRAIVSLQAESWDELAEPRALIGGWLEKSRVQISADELNKVPHDLWPAAQLPQLGLADRLTLALAGFGVTFQLTGDPLTLRFAAIPEKVTLDQLHTPRGDATKVAADLARKFPDVEVRREGAKIRVIGSYEDHDLIARLLNGERIQRTVVTEGTLRYTLKVERQPFRAVVNSLAEKLMLEAEFDPAVETQANNAITFEVKDATVEQLCAALTRAAGVGFTLSGKKLRIVPPGKL